MFFILFELFDYNCEILGGRRGPRGMKSIQSLPFFFFQICIGIHFSRLTMYYLLVTHLPDLYRHSACLLKKKIQLHLTPVPSPSILPELGSLLSLINSCFLCVLPCFVSHFFLTLPLFPCSFSMEMLRPAKMIYKVSI